MSEPGLPDQRAEVLAAIRRALGPLRPHQPHRPHEDDRADLTHGPEPAPPPTATRSPITGPLDTFIAAAQKVGTEVVLTPNPGDLDQLLETLCAELRQDRGLAADHPLAIGRPPLAELSSGLTPFELDLAVVEATLGIATLGSVLLEGPRLPPMTAEVTVALLSRAHLVPTLHDALMAHTPGPTRLLVTGPSKTADIEGVLITGVHGPRRFIVAVR